MSIGNFIDLFKTPPSLNQDNPSPENVGEPSSTVVEGNLEVKKALDSITEALSRFGDFLQEVTFHSSVEHSDKKEENKKPGNGELSVIEEKQVDTEQNIEPLNEDLETDTAQSSVLDTKSDSKRKWCIHRHPMTGCSLILGVRQQ